MKYEIERLNLLPTDENVTDLSSSYKTIISGYALIEDGKVVELDEDKDITIPFVDELKGNFNFNESNFKNVVVETNFFKADVVTPSLFYGANVDMNNLKVEVNHNETSLAKMTLSYNTLNAEIQTVYVFEK